MTYERTTPSLREPDKNHTNFRIVWAERSGDEGKWITRRRSTNTSDRKAAELIYRDFLQGFLTARKPTDTYRLDELAELYVREHCEPKSANLAKTQRHCLRAPILAFGRKRPDELKPQVWDQYIRDRRKGEYAGRVKRPVKDPTIRREMSAARAAMNWAVRKGLIEAADVKPMTLPSDGQRREVWLDEAQLETVLLAADKAPINIRTAVYLFAFTGARRGAVLDLRWNKVDFQMGKIDFRSSGYTGRKRRSVVPMAKRLRPILEDAAMASAAKGEAPDALVVKGGASRTFDAKFRAWADDNGWPELTPHVFRHTFITLRLRAGVDPWKIAGVLNEDLETLLKVYGHHRPDHLLDAVDI